VHVDLKIVGDADAFDAIDRYFRFGFPSGPPDGGTLTAAAPAGALRLDHVHAHLSLTDKQI
jgi:hypothetical protein